MSLPHITDDELIMYHLDAQPNVAVQDYIRRTLLDIATLNMHMIHEQFQWEWEHRLYDQDLE